MFSRKPAAANPRPASGSTSMRGSTFSVLGADTAIKGNVSASADLHIDGKVEGVVEWELTGQHNVANALACLAAARHVGVVPELGIAGPHLYPFGGFDKLFDWLASQGR